MSEGIYRFLLTVTDDDGAVDSDEAIVTVLAASVNSPPVANAGPDQSITLPTNSATITGSGSDNDGTIQAYLWEKMTGPAVTLTNETTNQLNVSNCQEGTYVFRLIVTDDG